MTLLVIADDVARLRELAGPGDLGNIFTYACDATIGLDDVPTPGPTVNDSDAGLLQCTRPRDHTWLHAAGTGPTEAAVLWADDGRAWLVRFVLEHDDPDASYCFDTLEHERGPFVCDRDRGHPEPHFAASSPTRIRAAWW